MIRLCQMARAGFYVMFLSLVWVLSFVFFSLLDWGPAGDPVQPRGCIHRMNMYLVPTRVVQQYQCSVSFRGILL